MSKRLPAGGPRETQADGVPTSEQQTAVEVALLSSGLDMCLLVLVDTLSASASKSAMPMFVFNTCSSELLFAIFRFSVHRITQSDRGLLWELAGQGLQVPGVQSEL